MGVAKEIKIPTINFNNPEIKPGTPEWESTKTLVFEALQEYGIFEAVYDKVPREDIFKTSKEIFEFPVETKVKTRSKTPNLHGYLGQFPLLPLYESLGIFDVLKPESVESVEKVFWPEGNPNFHTVLTTYSKPLVELDKIVKIMVLESLGMEKYTDELLDSCIFNMRLTHYGATKFEDGEKPGLSVHTDPGFLTLLSQNNVNGLEIQTKDGEWIDCNIATDSIVVISGDSFMAWTNGRLHSPVHRVTLTENMERFSIPLFAFPKPGLMIEARKELVDEEHPLLYKPFEILALYEFVKSGAGAKTGSNAFKAYSAINN